MKARKVWLCRDQGIMSFNIWPSGLLNTIGGLQLVCTSRTVTSNLTYGYNASTLDGQQSTCPNPTRQMKNVALVDGQIFYRLDFCNNFLQCLAE